MLRLFLFQMGLARARVEEFVDEAPFLRGRVALLMESGDLESVETTALTRNRNANRPRSGCRPGPTHVDWKIVFDC